MKTASAHITVCSRCGRTCHGLPTLSRVDNETLLCPDRRTRGALATLGVSEEEPESIHLSEKSRIFLRIGAFLCYNVKKL